MRADRRVAHEDVDRAELGQTLLHHRLHRGGVADVREHGERAHTGLATFLGDGVELLAVRAGVEHEVRALGREGQRDGPPDVSAGARDKRGLALQIHSAIVHAVLRGGRHAHP